MMRTKKRTSKKEVMSFTLDPQLAANFRKYAKEHDKCRSKIIETLITKLLEEQNVRNEKTQT